VLVNSGHPPLSPRLLHWYAFDIFHKSDPSESASDRHVRIDIARINPNPQTRFEKFWIKELTCLWIFSILLCNIIATNLVFHRLDMKFSKDQWLIEKL
jgi:hypothetical protein